ncbi:MAG: hypothetical protein HOP19_01750, partial [Acidobacteria bacterium]|nr:hypothetical protein [Acidobacteriota bacterium]
NPLRELPANLLQLPRLEKFDLRWVKLHALPIGWGELEARGCQVIC